MVVNDPSRHKDNSSIDSATISLTKLHNGSIAAWTTEVKLFQQLGSTNIGFQCPRGGAVKKNFLVLLPTCDCTTKRCPPSTVLCHGISGFSTNQTHIKQQRSDTPLILSTTALKQYDMKYHGPTRAAFSLTSRRDFASYIRYTAPVRSHVRPSESPLYVDRPMRLCNARHWVCDFGLTHIHIETITPILDEPKKQIKAECEGTVGGIEMEMHPHDRLFLFHHRTDCCRSNL